MAKPDYICLRCHSNARPIDGRPVTQVDVDGHIKHGATFCYLGDMLCVDDGCDSSTAARCCVAWESLGNSCPFSPSGTSCPRCVARYTQPGSIRLYSTLAKCGDPMPLTYSSSALMTAPWCAGSVAPKTEQTPSVLQIYYGSPSQPDALDMYSLPRPVSNL